VLVKDIKVEEEFYDPGNNVEENGNVENHTAEDPLKI
jgi:hypothetical protein